MAIPISMIFLSVALPARANRMTNIVVASLYVVVSIGNVVGEPWGYYFARAAGLEVAMLALIVRNAWTWRRTTFPAGPGLRAERMQPVDRR